MAPPLGELPTESGERALSVGYADTSPGGRGLIYARLYRNSLRRNNMPYDIIILGGQSNAEGYGLGETAVPYEPDERILMMRDCGECGYIDQPDGARSFVVTTPYVFKTEVAREKEGKDGKFGSFWLTFAKKYVEAGLLSEDRQLLIINGSVGGASFACKHWGIGNVLHDRLVLMMNEAKKSDDDRFVAFLWHQGEGDAYEETEAIPASKRGEIYYDDLMATVTDIRSKAGDATLPFIAGEYSPEWYLTIPKVCDAILDATQKVCDELGNGKIAKSEGLTSNNQAVGNGDNCHFSREALRIFGERYFDAYCEIKGINK